jgi:hypothetical protein
MPSSTFLSDSQSMSTLTLIQDPDIMVVDVPAGKPHGSMVALGGLAQAASDILDHIPERVADATAVIVSGTSTAVTAISSTAQDAWGFLEASTHAAAVDGSTAVAAASGSAAAAGLSALAGA